jgi:hypothetical protein
MLHCSQRIGEAYFRTPRNTVKEFIDLLSVLEQNQQVSWKDLVVKVDIGTEANPDLLPSADEDEDLASFRL